MEWRAMAPSPILSGLPVNLDDLLNRRTIEGNGLHPKTGWSHSLSGAKQSPAG
jgi:hypothetical protein